MVGVCHCKRTFQVPDDNFILSESSNHPRFHDKISECRIEILFPKLLNSVII